MSSPLSAGFTAALVTALSISCLGVLFAGLDYFLIEWLETALEFFGILPKGWGEAHFSALLIATLVTAVPPLAWLGYVLFRHSYKVELAMDEPDRID